jgi:hypothetical protein
MAEGEGTAVETVMDGADAVVLVVATGGGIAQISGESITTRGMVIDIPDNVMVIEPFDEQNISITTNYFADIELVLEKRSNINIDAKVQSVLVESQPVANIEVTKDG